MAANKRTYGSGSLAEIPTAKPLPRGVSRWRLRYRGHSRNMTGTRTEAKRALTKFVVDIDAGKPRQGTTPTVGTLLREYAEYHEMAETTRVTLTHIINVHLVSLHAIPADKLTVQQVEDLYRDLMSKGLKGSTVVRVHEVLRASLRRAVRLEIIDRAITDKVRPPSAARHINFDALETSTVLALLEAAYERSQLLGVFATFAAATGCRRGEIVALQWDDIDMDTGTAKITKALGHVGGGKQIVKTTKTGVGRIVFVDPMAIDALRRWRTFQLSSASTIRPPRGGYVFTPDPTRIEPWSAAAASNQWAHMVDRAGLGKVRLHDLRHWYASASIGGGGDVHVVARQLGHKSPDMTLRVYAHVVDDRPVDTLSRAMAEHAKNTGGATVTPIARKT